MSIKVKIESKVTTKTKSAIKIYEANVVRHLNRVANHFKNSIQISMRNTPKQGFVREDGHVTSVAPNPPAIDTGTLSNSLQVNPAGRSKMFSSVGTGIDYAVELQLIKQRNFMGKDSPARKDTVNFSNKIAKDIKINQAKLR